MIGLLCWLGYHLFEQVPVIAEKPNAWTTDYANARCRRCGRVEWFNW